MRIVSIHQPNFLRGWVFSTNGSAATPSSCWMMSSWFDEPTSLERVSRNPGRLAPFTCRCSIRDNRPTESGKPRIDSTQWRPDRLGRRLHHAYGKSPFWDELSPALLGTLNQEHRYLMELNQALLLWIGVELLDLSPSAMVSSRNSKWREREVG